MMAKLEKKDKEKLSKKLFKLQKKGLIAYRAYLEREYGFCILKEVFSVISSLVFP